MSNLQFPLADVGAFIDDRTPEYPVDTLEAKSGKRVSITWATQPRITYTVKQSCLRSLQRIGGPEYQRWLAFFERHFGSLDSFLLFDKENSTAADPNVLGGGMCFGIGDGAATSFQLQKRTLGYADDSIGGGPWRVSSGPRTNNMLRSADFTNVAWTKGTGVLAAANGAVAPDNTGASVIIYSGAGSAGGARVSQVITSTSTTPACISVWLRADSATAVALGNASGAVLSVSVSTAWQRFDFNVTPAVGGDVGLVIYSPTSVNTAFRIYAWGAQSEADVSNSGVPTSYIATTSAAVTVNPAFWPTYTDGVLPVTDLAQDGSLKIFRNDYQGNVQLFPWARTNACLQSQTFANATWVKTSAAVGSAVTAPDGTTTALPITSSATAATASQSVAGLTTGQTYTFSIWLKCVLGGSVQLGTSGGFSSVLTLNNTWQRFSVTFTASATSQSVAIGGNNSWANGQIIQAWGAQVEAGLTVTSYIPTTTATVSVTDYTLPGFGSVTFTAAPLSGAVLSWTGNYFIRVKILDTKMTLKRVVLSLWSIDGLQLIQVLS